MLFPSKKHVDATRAFASGFRGRKDGGGLERREEGGRTGNGKEGMRKDWACKKGRGGGGRK